MRIDPKVTTTPVTATSTAETRGKQPAPTPTGPAAGTSSVVNLSSEGAKAASAASSGSTGITGRLAVIKTQLDTGTYPVDLDRLSNRIVDDELMRGRGGKASS